MKTLTLIVLGFISSHLRAETLDFESNEIAYLLNLEMESLMEVAAKPKVWSAGKLPPRDQRSGPAPSQMQGVENLEERFFSDEVNFQSARSLDVPEETTEETPQRKKRLKASPDGTVSE